MMEASKYKGQLSDFPEEVIERMLFYQVGHGNDKDIQVFEENAYSDQKDGGFDWNNTSEGYMFWDQVIRKKNFDIFFFYYNKIKKEYPRLMLVSDFSKAHNWEKRVVFAKKCGKFLAWKTAETFEDSEYEAETRSWKYAIDIDVRQNDDISDKIKCLEMKLIDVSAELNYLKNSKR